MIPLLARLQRTLESPPNPHYPNLAFVYRSDLVLIFQLIGRESTTRLVKDFHFNLPVHQASWKGTALHLSRGMFLALYTIVTLKDGASYRDIYDAMKGRPGYVAGRNGEFKTNVRSEIKRLRRRLQAHGVPVECLKCRIGSGYYWDEKETANGV